MRPASPLINICKIRMFNNFFLVLAPKRILNSVLPKETDEKKGFVQWIIFFRQI
jgi:hypothetical protein